MWNTFFYLPGETDAGSFWVFLVATLDFMGGGLVVALEGVCTGAQHVLGARHDLGA